MKLKAAVVAVAAGAAGAAGVAGVAGGAEERQVSTPEHEFGEEKATV